LIAGAGYGNKDVLNSMIIGRLQIALLSFFCAIQLMAEPLPRPVGLEPDVAFWRRVFADVTSQQALIHDNRNLGVIYEKIDLPPDSTAKQRRRISERVREKYRGILNRLADGNRQGLTFEERRVLALWSDDLSNDALRKAANQLRFQQGLSDRFRDGYVRSGLWRDYIQSELQEAGVPEELVALPHVESSFNPEARSYVGASGLWQFTRSTGRRFMQIDHVVDERRDPFLSSSAAASLLAYNYSILKSWPLAITAYNHGVAGMRRAIRETGTDDIEVILRSYKGRSFGFASRNFYVALLAASDIDQNASVFFGELEQMLPQAEVVVTLADFVTTETLANTFSVSIDTLKEHNPALLRSVWSGTKFVPRGYSLRVPAVAAGINADAALAGIPANQRYSAQTPDLQHKVGRGDSLSVIAARYRTSVSELMALNNLKSRHRIRVGQTLNLPYRGQVSMVAIAEGTDTYVVQHGDTISLIARRAGIGESELLAINSLPDRNRIYPGQQLILISEVSEMAATQSAPASDSDETFAPVPAPNTSMPISSDLVLTPEADDVRADNLPVEVEDTVGTIPRPMAIADEPAESVADEVGQPAEQSAESVLLADPSDYFVAADNTIEVQAAETLGHYADWLDIRTQRLRDLNGYSFRRPVVIGQRIRLEFSVIDREEFAARRFRYHRELQEAFFTRYRITDTQIHRLSRGESLYVLTLRQYKVPVWLLRQYNPDLDLNRVQTGAEIVFPQIERVSGPDGTVSEITDAI
jgi:membrane-bound lytic murein transglycosylase D